MATADDERSPYEGGGAGKKYQINEDPQNVSQEAGQFNSSGVPDRSTYQGGNLASIGISELEQILIQKAFTRSEIQRLIDLLCSRITEESPSDIVVVERDGVKPLSPRIEVSTASGSQLKKRKHGDESHNSHAAIVSSRVVEEQVANAYKGNNGQAPRQYSKLINNNATCLPKTLMASPQHPATMENLPEELLSKIFIRLLAKQLAQMRSVNKSWNSLLSQSSFVKSHLRRSIRNSYQILLVFYEYVTSTHLEPFTVHTYPSCHHKLTNFIKPPVNPQFENVNIFRVIGAVNGLICYSSSDSAIHIWNPSLSAVLTLPPYSMPSGDCDSIETDFRFGFDPKTDDYKLVKLTHLKPPKSAVRWWLQIEIYSMRKGTWELITERVPSHIAGIISEDYVCADGHDGHLHWVCSVGEVWNPKMIVAFDLGSETFHEIPLPNSTLDHYSDVVLGVLSGKLCVMSWFGDSGFEVWVMEEYGVAESWVKRHVFSGYRDDALPLGFTSHNELLIDNDGLDLYDPVANKTEDLRNYRDVRGLHKIVEYVDSLVWVAPGQN